MKVFIPRWHPVKLNQLLKCHWARAAKLKRVDREMVSRYMHNIPKAEGRRRVWIRIVLGKGQRGGDVDAYHKSILDALVACGALKDDSAKWCELQPIEYARDWENWGTGIALEDLCI